MRSPLAMTCVRVCCLAASIALPMGNGRAATILEVNVDGTFTPIDKAIVPTAHPTIRVTLTGGEVLASVVLFREDNRAGFGGSGKTIAACPGSPALDCLSQISLGVYQGTIETLIGRNRIAVQTNASFVAQTMLNYTKTYEDLNSNGMLNVDEDINGDGLLNVGEDGNGNRLLDFAEDFNHNGVLNVREDLDGDSVRDPGEDLNGNGVLDTNVSLPVDAIFDPTATAMNPFGYEEQATTVVLTFLPGVSNVALGNYFRNIPLSYPIDVEPVGLEVDDVTGTRSFYVTGRVLSGTPPHEVSRILNGQAPGDYTFPPPIAPAFPLAAALIDPLIAPATVAAERIPQRLLTGASPNAAEGYEFTGAKGGFDDDGDVPDELDASWHHFFVQTYAAHRLIDYLPFLSPSRAVSVLDTGFGNGTTFLPDITAVRIVHPHDTIQAGAGGLPKNGLDKIKEAFVDQTTLQLLPHGTEVSEMCCGDGTALVLGTARRSRFRPVRTNYTNGSVRRAIFAAAMDDDTSVINCSWQQGALPTSLAARKQKINQSRANLLVDLERAMVNGKIVVVAAGNEQWDTELDEPAVFTVPRRDKQAVDDDGDGTADNHPHTADDPVESPQMIAVGATGVLGMDGNGNNDSPRGQERYSSSFASTGARVTMSAPGEAVYSVLAGANPGDYGFTDVIYGTSFAAPQVAGAVGELINVAEALPAGPLFGTGDPLTLRARTNQAVADLVVATGDDLGSLNSTIGVDRINDNAGDGSIDDNNFGFGRLNMWKAALSVASQGLAAQHGRTAQAGKDSVFVRIPLIADADTQWYGFEIITSERQATAWIDGTQLKDDGPVANPGNAPMPLTPNVTAYKGVHSDQRTERGVHTLYDGSNQDPVVGTVPGQVVEENPLTGIVPLGTHIDNKGQYVMTFSVPRSELYNAGQPRTLSLRKPGETALDKPFFNLRLNTAEMRTGRVSGVVFDDFVFQVTASDYGDASIGPTKRSDNGARHNDSSLLWLGRLDFPNLDSVSHEQNSDPDAQGGDATVDVDGVTNRLAGNFQDRDGRDDGVLFFPLTYKTGPGLPGKVRFTVNVHDATDPRYASATDRSVFANLWIDWNGNGIWEEANSEHVLDGVQIRVPIWNLVNQGNSGSNTFTALIAANLNGATFESQIPVGTIGSGPIWARMRVDYGENVGRNDPRPLFRSLPSLRDPALGQTTPQPVGQGIGYAYGAARFGEVEDYYLGSDFGDAADASCSIGLPLPPSSYPTCKNHEGARHIDMHREWLGVPSSQAPHVTREIDADDTRPPGTDQEGTANLTPEDDDLAEDTGVAIPNIVPGQIALFQLDVTAAIKELGGTNNIPGTTPKQVGIPEDNADSLPRYGGTDLRKIYIAGWADWNGSGNWEPGEKIIDDKQDPTAWGGDNVYTLGEPFNDDNKNGVCDPGEFLASRDDRFGVETKHLSYSVPVPLVIAPRFYMRFRVAYGEDEGETINLEVRESDEDGRIHNQDKGGALFGEVEDYVWPMGPPKVPVYTVGKGSPNGASLTINFNGSLCPAAVNYEIVYGYRSQFPITTSDPYGVSGAQCFTGPPPVLWSPTPDASLDPSHLVWFLVIANDGANVDGSWSKNSAGFERNGPGPSGTSGFCTLEKNVTNICGN